MTDYEPRDLDTLLNASAPATSPHGPERLAALEAMARDARSTSRRVRRPLAIGAGALALVLAGGAAAAEALNWPVPWAVGNYSYTLPSGAQCHDALVSMDASPEMVAAAEAFLARDDLLDVIDMDAALADARTGPHMRVLDDRTMVDDAGPGTEYWSADQEYQTAFIQALFGAMMDDLAAQGYEDSGVTMELTLNCPDAVLPEYMQSTDE
jgi:hypothetical protein